MNAIELNDSRAVNPAKVGLIQLLIEFRHAATQEVCLRAYMQAGVVIRRLNPVNLGEFEKRKLPGTLHRRRAIHQPE